ncbi:MAG: LPS-assembly protein LptD, partial [Epsilonproteobacteria bacterium]
IFWAISPSMDIEFNPQIRTSRSLGLYSTLRFVDTAHSSGELRLGYFKDKASYGEAFNLPNDSHYGIEFNYESSKIFSDSLGKGFKDGLYINTTYLNDIDYLNLQKSSLAHFGLVPLQESRINYFLSNNDYYAGLNAKYFIDTRKESNNDTLQILPSIQLHKYLDTFFVDNLTYAVDFHINNYQRKEGSTMQQAEFRIPLEFTTSFFDDYLSVSLGEEIYYSKFFFANDNYAHDVFEYYSNIHKVNIFSDLTKKYDDFIHVLQPSLRYFKAGNENQSPVSFDDLSDEQKELFTVGLPEEYFDLGLSQYFYDTNMKLIFFQRVSQKYYLDREFKLADLENEMQYNWKKWKFYSDVVYSYDFSKIREASTRVSLYESMYHFTLSHSYKKELFQDQEDKDISNDVSVNFGFRYNERIKFLGGLTYNVNEESSRQWNLGGSYTRDCWSFSTSIRQDITPRPTGFTVDNTFYLQVNFTPFGGIGTGDVP